MKRLTGKCALVTGAAQGLGAAIAHALAREGARVLLTDRNLAGATEAAEAINSTFGAETSFAARHDVTIEADWADAIDQARVQLGGLSVLVNNAGILLAGSIEEFDLDRWRHGMSVNVDSVFLGVKHALPLMRERQPGSIINMSSIAGLIASHKLANYNCSKAAIWMLTKSVALHCARQGWDIRCNSVHPTFVRTPILKDIVQDRDEDDVLIRLVKQVPLGRVGETADVAHGVVYLASDESRFVTGSELKIDGGVSAM